MVGKPNAALHGLNTHSEQSFIIHYLWHFPFATATELPNTFGVSLSERHTQNNNRKHTHTHTQNKRKRQNETECLQSGGEGREREDREEEKGWPQNPVLPEIVVDVYKDSDVSRNCILVLHNRK